ncbi:hypothetical protein ACHAQH_002353 [Verticillium albo-atrum]
MAPSVLKRVFALVFLATIGSTVAVSDSTLVRTGPDALIAAPSSNVATLKRRISRRLAQPRNRSGEGYSALGCFQIQVDSEASLSDPRMTPQLCRDICHATDGAAFGITAATECHCNVNVELLVSLADGEECSLPCPGDKGLSCGGAAGTMMVYAATDAEAPALSKAEELLSPAVGDEAVDEKRSVESTLPFHPEGSDDDDEHHDHDHERSSAPGGVDLGRGATIGIAVGAVALSGVITGIVMLLFCRRRRGREERAQSMDVSRGRGIYERAGPPPPPPPPPLSTDRGYKKPHRSLQTTISYAIPEWQERGPDRDVYEMSERRR